MDEPNKSFESSLPPLFMRIPPALLSKFPAGISKSIQGHLERNQGRLTSPFDLHQTLKHTLFLSINFPPEPETEPASHLNLNLAPSEGSRFDSNLPLFKSPESSSLFLEIPPSRSCATLHFPPHDHFCACNATDLTLLETEADAALLSQLARFALRDLNAKVESARQGHLCSEWQLKDLLPSQILRNGSSHEGKRGKEVLREIFLKFTASPGDSRFEGKLRVFEGEIGKGLRIEKMEDFHRTDTREIQIQSRCVLVQSREDEELKELCFCNRGRRKPAKVRTGHGGHKGQVPSAAGAMAGFFKRAMRL
jgi:Protein of unknown function (DUF229)